MSVDVRVDTLIRRPRAEVAAYLDDPSHDLEWTSGLVAVNALTEGPMRAGSRIERTSRFLGRTFSYLIEIQSYEPEARWDMTTTAGPFPMTVAYILEDAEDGTRMTIHTKGEPGGFFAVVSSVMGGAVRKSIQKDLDNLKRVLEATPAA